MKTILSIFLCCSLYAGAQTTRYINVDIPLSTVNGYSLVPGDSVLLQRGGSWTGQLEINYSGTHAKPIYFGAYGTGDNPVINTRTSWPGWNNTANWVSVPGVTNGWRFTGTYANPLGKSHRIWLNGVQYAMAKDSSALSSRYRYSYNADYYILWVYAPSNPATYFTSIEYPSDNTETVGLYGVNHIKLENLDIRGSNNGSIVLSGTRHIEIRNCNIGRDAGHIGINVFNKTDTTIIVGNTINSGDTCIDYFIFQHGLQDGIALNTGTHNARIDSNTILNWGHSNIEFTDIATDTAGKLKNGYSMSNVLISCNLSKAPLVDYDRAFGFDSRSDHRTSNIVCRYNKIDSFTVRSQIETRYLDFSYNVISNIRTGTSIGMVSDAGAGLMVNPYSNTSGDSMTFVGNTFVNTDEPGILLSMSSDPSYGTVGGNLFANNLFVNCGRNATPDYAMNYVGIGINPLTGPSKILGNTFRNNLSYNSNSTNVFFDNRYAVGSQKKTASQWNATNGDSFGNTVTNNQYGVVSLNTSGEPATGSPVIGAGLDLGSTYNQLLLSGSTWPSGVKVGTQSTLWNIGAYSLLTGYFKVYTKGGKVLVRSGKLLGKYQ